MYETRNETNRLSVTSGEETDPSDLIFRLLATSFEMVYEMATSRSVSI
jgi:hypothetical protein